MSVLSTVPQGKGWINTINDNFKKFNDQGWQTNVTMTNGWTLTNGGYKVISLLGIDYLIISMEVNHPSGEISINRQTWTSVCNLPLAPKRFTGNYIARYIYSDNNDNGRFNIAYDNNINQVGFATINGTDSHTTGLKINLIIASA